MLADHAARVFAGRSRFGAKTLGPGCIALRQFAFLYDRSPNQIGQRNLGGRNQPIIVLGSKKIFAELGQLPRAEQSVVADQCRRHNLLIAEFIRMHIKHEGCQCPFEPGQGAFEDDKPGAR